MLVMNLDSACDVRDGFSMCWIISWIVECLFQDYVMIILIYVFDYFVSDCFLIVVDFTRKVRENCESELIIV